MVKRYDEGGYGLSNMEESADGSWVDYEAHLMVVMGMEQLFNDKIAALQQERDALAADRERFAAQCAAAKIAVQYAQAAGFNCTLNTPDVDYFMNAMRAEGVEMAASDLFETTAIGHGMLMAFAAKLRANKDGE